ncbi:MAG: hypothetical protein ACO39Y_09815, partial [Ilumatobacteraceae bacterium]
MQGTEGASNVPERSTAAALASSIVVDEEAKRANSDVEIEESLPTIEAMSLKDGLRKGGSSIAVVLLLFTIFEEFDRVAMQVL